MVRRQILSVCEPLILGKVQAMTKIPYEIPAEIRDLKASPMATPGKEVVAGLQTCGTLAARRQEKPYGKGA
jgi:hypothetical protein